MLLGNTEDLQTELSGGNAGQVALFLIFIAIAQQCTHDVHLGVTGAAVTAGRLDLLHDYRRFGQGSALTAVLLGNQRRKQSAFTAFIHKFGGIVTFGIQLTPVGIAVFISYGAHPGAQFVEISTQINLHSIMYRFTGFRSFALPARAAYMRA